MSQTNKRRVKPSGWKLFNLVSLLLTGVILLGVVVGNRGVGGLLARWRSLDARWTAAAAVCMLVYWLLESVSLHMLTGCVYRGVPFCASMRTAMVGQLYSALTPFSSGGQPVQLIYMQRDGLDTGGGASVLTVKSIVYQVGVMLVALVAVVSGYSLFKDQVPGFWWITALGFGINLMVTVGMLLLAISPHATRRVYRFIVKLLAMIRLVQNVDAAMAKAQAQFDIYHQSTQRYEKKRGVLACSILVTLAQLILLYLVPYAIYRAFGYGVPGVMLRIVAAVAFVSMVSAFVPLPGGAGGAEGSFLLFFGLFFLPNDLLVALLLWRLVTYYSCMVVGALVVLISRKRQRACVRLPL